MTDQDKALNELLRKISEAEDRGEMLVPFTREEARALKAVASFWRAWEAIGFLASSARTILTWLGFMIAAWIAFKAGLLEWIAKGLVGR